MDDTQLLMLELGSQGYSCGQIVLAAGLRLMGRENPDLIRTMGGLAQGVGCSGEICGALSGGVCLLALHTAKGLENELPLPLSESLMNGLVEWFRTEIRHGGSLTCDSIMENANSDTRGMNSVVCGTLVATVCEKALRLLIENGIDPTTGREVP